MLYFILKEDYNEVLLQLGVGTLDLGNDDLFFDKMRKLWKVIELPFIFNNDIFKMKSSGNVKNLFIFVEDPKGYAKDKHKTNDILSKSSFKVVRNIFRQKLCNPLI